jgi:hypothetical protein
LVFAKGHRSNIPTVLVRSPIGVAVLRACA